MRIASEKHKRASSFSCSLSRIRPARSRHGDRKPFGGLDRVLIVDGLVELQLHLFERRGFQSERIDSITDRLHREEQVFVVRGILPWCVEADRRLFAFATKRGPAGRRRISPRQPPP